MENIGERLVGDYLNVILGCDFVAYNLHTPDVQGEIDVVGIQSAERRLYVCEVTTHLVTGMLYVDPVTKAPDNVGRFVRKFAKNAAFARARFPDHEHRFMLWSPIVRRAGPRAKHDQLRDIEEIRAALLRDEGIALEVICNEGFQERIDALRRYAGAETKELKSPVLRLFQIEERLARHLGQGRARG